RARRTPTGTSSAPRRASGTRRRASRGPRALRATPAPRCTRARGGGTPRGTAGSRASQGCYRRLGRASAVMSRLRESAIEAGAFAGVACGAIRIDENQQRVAVAVVPHLFDVLYVARRRALVPELLARAAPEPRRLRVERALQRLGVHPRNHQHLAGVVLLHHRGDQPFVVVLQLRHICHGFLATHICSRASPSSGCSSNQPYKASI